MSPNCHRVALRATRSTKRGNGGARHRRQGVTATWRGDNPLGMLPGSLVFLFTAIVDTVRPLRSVTNAVLPSGVTATPFGFAPTGMSVRLFDLVSPSIVDTVPLALLATKAVLPSGVTATPTAPEPTAMSVKSFVPVFTWIVDTVPMPSGVDGSRFVNGPKLVTKAVLPSGVTATPAG